MTAVLNTTAVTGFPAAPAGSTRTAPARDAGAAPVVRFTWQPVPTTPVGPDASPSLHGRRITVIGGTAPEAAEVIRVLTGQGALVDGRIPTDRAPDAIVDLTLGTSFDPVRPDAWRLPFSASITALRACYPDWARETDARRLSYLAVTYLDGQMGYHGGGRQPLGGIWAGLAKTLHRELPNVNIRVLDLAGGDRQRLAELIARELYRPGPFEIGYRDGIRYTLLARPDEVDPPALDLGPGDTVLISGGGRGLGHALAIRLARNTGCQVFVTGRHELPTGDESWAELDDEAFRAFRHDLWRRVRDGWPAARVRAEIDRISGLRELHGNLSRAATAGLPVRYLRCDITDPDTVRDLLDRIGSQLTGVIHNAGVDRPRRLPAKPDEEITRTVATKVEGFLHLFNAVRGRQLRFFCSVGSLTGRLGGMVGQLDYAAGNDGLARLGLWAAGQVNFPVFTLGWPTWDRLGMVTNFEASLRYMAALDVAEGLHRWERELRAPISGEVSFIGPIGDALSPSQARGYPLAPAIPRLSEVYPRIFHLGTVTSYQPHQHLHAQVQLDQATVPALGDLRIGAAPALPVSLLLDHAVAAAEWTMPEHSTPLRLRWIEDITLDLNALRLIGSTLVFERRATGAWRGTVWSVQMRLDVLVHRRRHPMAQLTLVYDGRPADRPEAVLPEHEVGVHKFPDGCRERTGADASGQPYWRGLVIPVARWRRHPDRWCTARVSPAPPADLWAVPAPPASRLPVAALENIIRAILLGDPLPDRRLSITRITCHGDPSGADLVATDLRTGLWYAAGSSSRLPTITLAAAATRRPRTQEA